jgi:hypothetical protein
MSNGNKRVDKTEIGFAMPRPNDEVVWINTQSNSINVYDEQASEWIEVGGNADFTVPTAIKDSNGDDLITFEKTGYGTARIGTPQDDLSLRSARDITLYAGNDGPGNVYIGWGDAQYTGQSDNMVTTLGGSATFTNKTYHDAILKDNVVFTNIDDEVRLQIEHGGTGVVRIHATEDDLALRSHNDILLYAGDVGPGNVYIGWGDATITPDATNRVATIGDLPTGATGSFTTASETVTVTDGIITAITPL